MTDNGDTAKNEVIRNYVFFVIAFLLIALAVDFKLFINEFGHHNDYGIWHDPESKIYSETPLLFVLGRPLGALLLNMQVYFVNDISDLSLLRFITFLATACYSLIFAKLVATHLNLDRSISFFMALFIFLLPSSQLFIHWVVNFVPGSLNIVLAALVFIFLDSIRYNDGLRKYLIKFAVAEILFIASLLIYPLTSLSILVFTFSKILSSDVSRWPSVRRDTFRDLIFTFSGLAVVFAYIKLFTESLTLPAVQHQFPRLYAAYEGIMSHDFYKISFVQNLSDKTELFRSLADIAASGPFHMKYGDEAVVYTISTLLIIAGAVLIGGLVNARFRQARRPIISNVSMKAQKIALSVAVAALSISPLLLASGVLNATYRTSFTVSVIVVILFFWLVDIFLKRFAYQSIRTTALICLMVITAYAAFTSYGNVRNVVENDKRELSYVREQIASLKGNSPLYEFNVIPLPRGAYYGTNQLFYEFKESGSLQRGLYYKVFEDENVKLVGNGNVDAFWIKFWPLADVDSSNIKNDFLFDVNSPFINMNRARENGLTYGEYVNPVLVTTSLEVHYPAAVFNWKDTWKAEELPQWIQLEGQKPFKIVSYTIYCEHPLTIPLKWKLLASDDAQNWTTVDAWDDSLLKSHRLMNYVVPASWDIDMDLNLIRRVVNVRGSGNLYRFYRLQFEKGKSDTVYIMRIQLR